MRCLCWEVRYARIVVGTAFRFGLDIGENTSRIEEVRPWKIARARIGLACEALALVNIP